MRLVMPLCYRASGRRRGEAGPRNVNLPRQDGLDRTSPDRHRRNVRLRIGERLSLDPTRRSDRLWRDGFLQSAVAGPARTGAKAVGGAGARSAGAGPRLRQRPRWPSTGRDYGLTIDAIERSPAVAADRGRTVARVVARLRGYAGTISARATSLTGERCFDLVVAPGPAGSSRDRRKPRRRCSRRCGRNVRPGAIFCGVFRSGNASRTPMFRRCWGAGRL